MPTTRPDDDASALQELAVLHESLRALTSTLDLGEVLRTLLARARALTVSQALSLLLYDPQRDELVFAATETLGEQTLVRRVDAGGDGEIDLTGRPDRLVVRFSCPERRAACLVVEGPVGAAAFPLDAQRRLEAQGDGLG